MNVLPMIKEKWTNRLRAMHFVISALMLITLSFELYEESFDDRNKCAKVSMFLSETLMVFTLLVFAIIRLQLRIKLDRIEKISELDNKILWRYERILRQLN